METKLDQVMAMLADLQERMSQQERKAGYAMQSQLDELAKRVVELEAMVVKLTPTYLT